MQKNELTPLFLAEAVKYRVATGLGNIRLAQPISYMLISTVFVAISIVIIVFVALSSYTKKAHVVGITVPKNGSILINAPLAGRINKIFVVEGQRVNAGDRILEVVSERETVAGEVSILVATQLGARLSSLEKEEKILISQRGERELVLGMQIRNTERQLSQIENELNIAYRRTAISNTVAENYQKLHDERYMPILLVQQKQEEILDNESRFSALERAKIDLQTSYSNISTQRIALSNSLASDEIQIKKSRAMLSQEIIENESRKSDSIPTVTITASGMSDADAFACDINKLRAALPNCQVTVEISGNVTSGTVSATGSVISSVNGTATVTRTRPKVTYTCPPISTKPAANPSS